MCPIEQKQSNGDGSVSAHAGDRSGMVAEAESVPHSRERSGDHPERLTSEGQGAEKVRKHA